MEILQSLLDFIFHIDKHLDLFVQQHGAWVYLILFAIIFVETGLVVMPFLPGDSLLFIVGAFCARGTLDFAAVCATLLVAAILGDQLNYTVGRSIGPKVFQWENSRFFNRNAFNKTHSFYEKHGGITIILARFMPFVRTFAPFVAGVAEMSRAKFTAYNIVGALVWVIGLLCAGFVFGDLPWVKANLEKIIYALIIIPALPALYGAWRSQGPAP